ncbi:hypothetical protein SISNIDRAFT_483751 [Sistotremastrum niveocremeum HHB9708]|uniref:F-box domain-containing protein n=1 Tax=Sistotremastrum niveocremeum HHB9708 TaxID=1314777 RepID=A0A164X025_9AGAM|nr:hypothetical protein SISNIDRAFT_483751 [Sistotremastrum niveocremeum HHB9708]
MSETLQLPLEILRHIAYFIRDPDPPLFQNLIESLIPYGESETVIYREECTDLLNLTLISKAVKQELDSILWSHLLLDLRTYRGVQASFLKLQSLKRRHASATGSPTLALVLVYPITRGWECQSTGYNEQLLEGISELFQSLCNLWSFDLLIPIAPEEFSPRIPINFLPRLSRFRFSGAVTSPDSLSSLLIRHPNLTDVTLMPTLGFPNPNSSLTWRNVGDAQALRNLSSLRIRALDYPQYLPRSLQELSMEIYVHWLLGREDNDDLETWLDRLKEQEPFENLLSFTLEEEPEYAVAFDESMFQILQRSFPNLREIRGTGIPQWLQAYYKDRVHRSPRRVLQE